MGIIGSGALGQATANLARALGMHVLLAERKGQVECRDGYTSFEQVLAQSDVLSLHCPLTDETRNIISEAELAQMNPNALLINTGRGGLVDEQALVDALKRRQIAGAGVDVFSAEPADMDNPLIANRDLPNLLLTPHVAWGSDSSIQQLATILIDNISAFMRGEAKIESSSGNIIVKQKGSEIAAFYRLFYEKLGLQRRDGRFLLLKFHQCFLVTRELFTLFGDYRFWCFRHETFVTQLAFDARNFTLRLSNLFGQTIQLSVFINQISHWDHQLRFANQCGCTRLCRFAIRQYTNAFELGQ